MASVTCPSCGWENEPGENVCLRCSAGLEPRAEAGEPPPPPPAPTAVVALPAAPQQCPYCDAEVPDPRNLACTECLRPFPSTPAAASTPAVQAVSGTRRDPQPGSPLRLVFAAGGRQLGQIDLRADDEVLIGREPASVCAGLLDPWDNVSRRHAVIGLDADGSAWIRDQHSTNGTAVNDVPVAAGRRAVLQEGDRVRFGADVVAQLVRPEQR